MKNDNYDFDTTQINDMTTKLEDMFTFQLNTSLLCLVEMEID